MLNVVVINYGLGNTKSVLRGLEKIGATGVLSDDPNIICNADRLILPGVGAFEQGMIELKKRGLIDAVQEFVLAERPLMGICLGMQMLFESSEEGPGCSGLGIIEGSVVKIPKVKQDNLIRKIPHIGWNKIERTANSIDSNCTILNDIRNKYYYFVHSFIAKPLCSKHIIAVSEYDDFQITSIVQKDNNYGLQFHPEKSGPAGLYMLKNFMNV